jgi:hypothetical protein
MLVDIFARQRRRQPKYKLLTFYGQLQHIFCLRFEAACYDLGINGPTTIMLGVIRTCVLDKNQYPKGLDFHPYSRHGALHYVDVKNIQCLVARIRDRDQWTIVDRSGALARALFVDDE